jgi:hypothetical protein
MKEGLLLCWIASQRGDVVGGYTQMSAFVETDLTDTAFTFLDEATMSAGITL